MPAKKNKMKFMVIGSSLEDKEGFLKTCQEIAKVLLDMNATLIICSLFEDSADFLVYEEFCKKSNNIELHFLDIQNVRKRIEDVNASSKIKLFPYLSDECKLDIRDAYLFCQINAIKQADIIIGIGGKVDGSANMLLYIAEVNKKQVIPFIKYGGAAENYYQRNKYSINDYLGDDQGVILSNDVSKIIEAYAQGKREKRAVTSEVSRVFISYARDNPTWADYIEVVLRRRKIELFRDETEFKAGSDIPKVIEDEIYKADTFIAVWCRDYACSPWCIDELELALERGSQINLWIICVDDTRIVPKKARNLLYYRVSSRDELEGRLLSLLNKS